MSASTASGALPAEEERSHWLRGLWIYAVMLVAALVGIGFTSSGGPQVTDMGPRIAWVWAGVLPIYCAVCIWHGWAHAAATGTRVRLVATQALHWLAFFVAMQLTLLDEVRGVLNDDAEGVALIVLLSIGTFVAGVHAWSVPICLIGVVLAAAAPLIAWVEQTAVLLFIVAGCAVLLFVPVWLFWRYRARPAVAALME